MQEQWARRPRSLTKRETREFQQDLSFHRFEFTKPISFGSEMRSGPANFHTRRGIPAHTNCRQSTLTTCCGSSSCAYAPPCEPLRGAPLGLWSLLPSWRLVCVPLPGASGLHFAPVSTNSWSMRFFCSRASRRATWRERDAEMASALDAAVPFDMLSWRSPSFLDSLRLVQAAGASRRPVELSTNRWRWPAWSSEHRVSLRECDESLHGRTRPPGSTDFFPSSSIAELAESSSSLA